MESTHFDKIQMMKKPREYTGKLLRKFQCQIENKYKVKFDNYWEFHKWTVENIAEFWAEMWHFSEIICSKSFEKVIDLTVPMHESPEWFQGSRMNYAENLLKFRDDSVALILAGEDRESEKLTYAQLYEETKLYATAFRKNGLKKGDIVVCYMSNRKEAVIAMLAAVSIGAIWSGALPLLGVQAVLNRFQEIKPKFLITVDRFRFDGREVDMLQKIKLIAEGVFSLEKVLIVASKEESKLQDISEFRNSYFLDDFLLSGGNKDDTIPSIEFEQVPFNYPVYINFTSGTTGPPKAIIHNSGCLLSVTRDFVLHFDSDRDSIWFSVSPVGWASWSMFTSLLLSGQCLLLYEGQPFYLTSTYFWDLVEHFKLTHLFLPPSILEEFERRNIVPKGEESISSVKYMFSGSSIVKPSTYDFIYRQVKKDMAFTSVFGCTEIMGCCIVYEPTLPVYRGEIPVPSLGNRVHVVDENGEVIEGEIGEIILCDPAPNLLCGYWGDKDGSLMKEKYFTKFPGKFNIGDYGYRNPVTKGYVVCYRSDETLKQRGYRFGSVEIYNVVDTFPEILDSLCVSYYTEEKDEHAVLFLQMRPGHTFNKDLVDRIRESIARELTFGHVPDQIIETPAIPYNLNGKKMEILVKKIINGMPYNAETVRNMESLQYYHNIPQLHEFA